MWESPDDDRLTTFAVYGKPRVGVTHTAQQLPPHRVEYLTYEGPISNNRGQVTRCDQGTAEILQRTENHTALALVGDRLQCKLNLHRHKDHWLITFEQATQSG